MIVSFWRLLEYFNYAGHVLRRKGRVCIQGNQISAEDNDFDYCFSSTVSYDQVCVSGVVFRFEQEFVHCRRAGGVPVGATRAEARFH